MSLNILKLSILLSISCFSSVIYADELKAIPWVKVKSETDHAKKICSTLKIQCGQDISVWKKKNSTDSKLYLTDETPQLVELSKVDKQYKLLNSWNFKNYQHHSKNSTDDELADFGTEVFPAFYPLNRQNYAIALVKHWGTSYSGGGRGEEIADFLMLESNGQFKTVLAEIPFYSYEMIRACFTEKDYKTSPHCHDESGSTLSIQFKDVGKPHYQWALNYIDFTWDASKSEKFKKIKRHSDVVMPFGQKAK